MRHVVMHAPGDVRVEEPDDPTIIEPTDAAPGRAAVISVLLAACLTACSSSEPGAGTPASPRTSEPDVRRSEHPPVTTNPDENTGAHAMQIRISVAGQNGPGQRVTATLTDSAAARDLLAQLPVTVDMVDHGGVEKTGPLPQALSLEGQPDGADPDVGDLGYYAPGHDLVLYYGDQSYYPGIVILGHLDGDAADRIASMNGAVAVTIETTEDH